MAHETAATGDRPSFAFGLTAEDVEELRRILREECHEEVSLEEAWSRAAGLLALTQLLIDHDEAGPRQPRQKRLERRPT